MYPYYNAKKGKSQVAILAEQQRKMLKIKSVLHLEGKNPESTAILSTNGCKYRIIGIQLGKAFNDKDGPWYLIQSLENDFFYTYIHDSDDDNYTITSVEEPK